MSVCSTLHKLIRKDIDGRVRVTSPSPARPVLDGVGEVGEVQVDGRALGEVGETLRFGDVVLDLLQLGQHGRLLLLLRLKQGGEMLAVSVASVGPLHGDTDRMRFQRLIVHN